MADLSYDVAVIGAGHNGLTLGTYLQRAGLSVGDLRSGEEHRRRARRPRRSPSPGSRHNLHSMLHYWISHGPVYSELDLPAKGHRYVYPDAQYAIVFKDGRSLVLYKDLERTCEQIARFSRRDAEAYRDLYTRFEAMLPAAHGGVVPAADGALDRGPVPGGDAGRPGAVADAGVVSADLVQRDVRVRRGQGVDRADGGPGGPPVGRRGRLVHGHRLVRRRARCGRSGCRWADRASWRRPWAAGSARRAGRSTPSPRSTGSSWRAAGPRAWCCATAGPSRPVARWRRASRSAPRCSSWSASRTWIRSSSRKVRRYKSDAIVLFTPHLALNEAPAYTAAETNPDVANAFAVGWGVESDRGDGVAVRRRPRWAAAVPAGRA